MFKSFLLVTALSLGLSPALEGCNPPDASAVTATTTFIAEAQAEAKAICSVVPTAASIVALFASGDSTLTTIAGIAGAICGAVGAKTRFVAGVHAPVMVKGVTVYFQRS